MSQPTILITSGRHNQAAGKTEMQTVLVGCNIHYVEAVLRAGGVPMILPPLSQPGSVAAALSKVDGVLLSGGGDINSLIYGEEPHDRSKYQDYLRDDVEIELVNLAIEMGLPILGVCRGIQLLNVALGGTLVQDIPTQVRGACKHYSQGINTTLLHNIDIEADSLLARVLGTTSMPVNSWHHQAVKTLGTGLRTNAIARDGIIEGLEAEDGRPILAVQYHPEECASRFPGFQELFDWLVKEAESTSRS
jgi:putative glutamine amidotransferase